MRVTSLDLISSRTSLAVEDGERSSLNAARVQRMLRELGCSAYPLLDSSVTRDSDRSPRSLGLSSPLDHRKAPEESEAQLEVERRLHAEARKLAEAIKAWEEAVARTHIEIEYEAQPEGQARGGAGAGLEIERKAREEAEGAEKMIDTAGRAYSEAINRTLAEMMARVQVEQREITEKRVRAAAEYCAQDETAELLNQKHGVLYKVLFHSRNRLPPRFHPR